MRPVVKSAVLQFFRTGEQVFAGAEIKWVRLARIAIEKGVDEFIHSISQPKSLLYLISMSLVFLLSSTWFVRWYLQKLYGDHVEKLKKLLDDIRE